MGRKLEIKNSSDSDEEEEKTPAEPINSAMNRSA